MNELPSETGRLLERLRAGDCWALADLLHTQCDRLRRMVELRMDARCYDRIDASDLLQDGFLDLAKRVESYLSDPRPPVFLWLRLAMIHRHHLGTRIRRRDETAVVLGITEEAGAKRYIRALKKLKTILAAMPGGLEGL